VPAVAEILCKLCGTRRTIPVIARQWLVPVCECGSRPQVVRVFRVRSHPGTRDAGRAASV
jgi:hypothetical protein